jgi:hypothetical protein
VITSISPTRVNVGEKLTVKGKNFTPGANKTRVFFVRRGGGTAFARAETASKTKLVVTVPAQLDKVLKGKSARVRLRILTKKFGKLSLARKSPIIGPAAAGTGDPGSDGSGGANDPSAPEADCDKDGTPNGVDTDDDNDLLSDTEETQFATDPCNADTDGDGVQDGFEYFSALDLNRTVLFGSRPPTPYPGKRPYPNPLFPDADADYDGDGLSLGQESQLWTAFGGHTTPLNYSDGLQTSVETPAPGDEILQQLDTASGGNHYGDGWLDDAERDADGDGLSNWDEYNGRLTPKWWEDEYKESVPVEKPYPYMTFTGTNAVDPDTDGDGVLDGADDQDHDGLSNMFEVARPYDWKSTYISVNGDDPQSGTNPYARTNPFNPCKPVYSETCHRHVPFGYYEGESWQGLDPADAGAPAATPGPIFP